MEVNVIKRMSVVYITSTGHGLRMDLYWSHVFILLILNHGNYAEANYQYVFGKKLFNDLMIQSGYNRLIRPVKNKTDKIRVKIGIKFSQLIDLVSFDAC